MAKNLGKFTNKVKDVEFFSDEYEGTAYNYAVLTFQTVKGRNHQVRLKGLKDADIVIVDELCVNVVPVEPDPSTEEGIDLESDDELADDFYDADEDQKPTSKKK